MTLYIGANPLCDALKHILIYEGRSVKHLHACSLSQDISGHNPPRCDRQDVCKRK